MSATQVTSLERSALIAALQSPNHTLRHYRGVFIGVPNVATSGPAECHAVTKRMALRLEREGLVELDDLDSPSSLSLNDRGRQLAEQLQAQAVSA